MIVNALRALYGLAVLSVVMWAIFWFELLDCVCRRRTRS